MRNSKDYGFFNSNEKSTDKAVVFASVYTLGKKGISEDKSYFAPDYFDYLIIDEFHHAVNEQYRNIVEYFKPVHAWTDGNSERMDGKYI